jgi:hypothetical protein
MEVWLHTFFDLGTRWLWVVSFTPLPLFAQCKSPWYPLDRGLGGPQSQSGRGGEKENSQPPPGIEPPLQVELEVKGDKTKRVYVVVSRHQKAG